MNIYKQYFLVIFVFLLSSSFAYNQIQVPDGVLEAIKMGNSNKLAGYFNSNIELVILDDSGVYTKSQSEIIVDDFFSVNKPNGFQIIHEGEQLNSNFVIGRLKSSSGEVFRVYFLMRQLNSEIVITQLKIEEE